MPHTPAGYHTMFDNPYWATGGNIQRGPYTGGASPGQGGVSPHLPPRSPSTFYDGTLPGDPGTSGGRRLIPGDPNYGVTNPVRTPQPISLQPPAPRQQVDFDVTEAVSDAQEWERGRGAGGGGGAVGGQGFNEWFGWGGQPSNIGFEGWAAGDITDEPGSFRRDDSPFGWAPPMWGQRAGGVASMVAGGGLPGMLLSGLTGAAFDATRDRNFAAKEQMRGLLGLPLKGIDEEGKVIEGAGRNIDNAREIWADLEAEVAAIENPHAQAGASMMLSNMQLGGDAFKQDESGQWGVAPMNLGGTFGTGIGSTEGPNDWQSYTAANAVRAATAATVRADATSQARRDLVANNAAAAMRAAGAGQYTQQAQQTAMQDPVAMNQWGGIDFSQYALPNVVVPDDFNFDVSAYGGFEAPPAAPAPVDFVGAYDPGIGGYAYQGGGREFGSAGQGYGGYGGPSISGPGGSGGPGYGGFSSVYSMGS